MRHCYVLRVFTRGETGGNPLGVVTDVNGLDSAVMQEIATDLGFSETIFLDWRDAGVPVTRIFTPATELPFAGHPLVGAAWVMSVIGPGGPGRLRCQVGEVGYRREEARVWVDAPVGQPVREPVGSTLAAIDELIVEMPLEYRLVQLDSPNAVARLEPPPSDAHGVYVWAWMEPHARVKARFFGPEMGVAEDPATGSAAVALAAALAHRGAGSGRLAIHQGDEIGYPSEILLEWAPGRVAIGGTVVRDEVRVLRR